MEMEREVEWRAIEGEAAAGEFAGLETREMRKGRMGRENEDSKKLANGEENSVYFEGDKGVWKCRHCTWTYHLCGPGIDVVQKHEGNCQVMMEVETLSRLGTYIDPPIKGAHVDNGNAGLETGEVKEIVAEENLANGISDSGGISDAGGRGANDNNSVPVEEQSNSLRDAVTESRSNSLLDWEKISKNEVTRSETEILEEHLTHGESSSLVPAEYDVERVIREQETHDLICPNCHSCITKRVILRKRKRTPQESPSDLPPPKIQLVPEDNTTTTETEDHEDETVFRCLSCLSYFLPTEGIFRIFGKRTTGDNMQSSEKKPARNMNWVTSCFGSSSSQKEEARVPLLSETNTDSNGDPSLGLTEDSSPISTPEATNRGEKGTATGIKNEGLDTPSSHSNGVLMGNQAQGDEQKDQGQKTARDPSSGYSYSNGGQMDNKTQGKQQMDSGTALLEDHGTKKPNIAVEPLLPNRSSQITDNINGYIPPVSSDVASESKIRKPHITISPGNTTETNQNVAGTPVVDTLIDVGVQGLEDAGRRRDWDVLKSIVYGGLIESITSLSVVSSAAGSGSSTLNICALGLANVIGGLFVIAHDLSELKSAHDAEFTNQREEQKGRYWEKLGKRVHFRRHVFFAILSYSIFGLLPPLVYGFAFRKSDNKEYKLIAVATSSLLCIALLAIGKAHVKPQKGYIKSLFYYLGIAVPASGLSYVAGVMIDRLMVELGLFEPSVAYPPPQPSSVELFGFGSGASSYAF